MYWRRSDDRANWNLKEVELVLKCESGKYDVRLDL